MYVCVCVCVNCVNKCIQVKDAGVTGRRVLMKELIN